MIQKKTRTGCPCGSKVFIGQIEALTGRILHPRRPGPYPKARLPGIDSSPGNASEGLDVTDPEDPTEAPV